MTGILQDMPENVNIDEDDAALLNEMRAKYLEKYITNKHSYKICQRKDGRWQTKVKAENGVHSVGAATRDKLLKTLYKHYSKEGVTLESLYPAWIADKEKQYCSQTTDRNRQDWKRYLEGTNVVKIPVKDLRASDWMIFATGLVGYQSIKRHTYKNVKTVVNGILDYAVLHDIIQYNVLHSVTHERLNFKPDIKDREDDCFTLEEYDKLFSFLETHMSDTKDSKYAALLILQLCTGMRVGEIKALHWSDYNSLERTFWVHREVVYRKETPDSPKRMVEVPYTKAKKAKANRVIPIPDKAIEAVEFLRSIAKETFGEFLVAKGDALLISNSEGGFIDTNKYNKWIHRYCKKAGISTHTSHDSRRFAISKMLNEGLDANTVQHIAGHLNFSTTEAYVRDIGHKANIENVRRALG